MNFSTVWLAILIQNCKRSVFTNVKPHRWVFSHLYAIACVSQRLPADILILSHSDLTWQKQPWCLLGNPDNTGCPKSDYVCPTLLHVLPHTRTHYTQSLEPGGLKLTCHTVTTGKDFSSRSDTHALTGFVWCRRVVSRSACSSWIAQTAASPGGGKLGDSYLATLPSDTECSIVSRNNLCLKSWDINNSTVACLPFFLCICLWIPSFVSDWVKQNVFLCISPWITVKQTVHCNTLCFSFYPDVFSTRALGDGDEKIFSPPNKIFMLLSMSKYKHTLNKRVFHSQPGKSPPLNQC